MKTNPFEVFSSWHKRNGTKETRAIMIFQIFYLIRIIYK